MSETILSAGSTEPPKAAGKQRLYGLKLSPSTQQVRLILLTKNVPHDLVNVNPRDVPDWYSKIQPEKQFPALDTGDKVLVGTQAIVEYVDAKFPNPPLSDPGTDSKAVIANILQQIEPLSRDIKILIENKNAKPSGETTAVVERLSERLKTSGTTFLAGNNPGLPDFLVWPWIQAGTIRHKLHGQDPVSDELRQRMSAVGEWKNAMEKLKAVQDVIIPTEAYSNYLK